MSDSTLFVRTYIVSADVHGVTAASLMAIMNEAGSKGHDALVTTDPLRGIRAATISATAAIHRRLESVPWLSLAGAETPPESDQFALTPGEFDAKKWAESFVAHVRSIPSIPTDEATMYGWFANAIMAGYDRGRADASAALPNAKYGFQNWSLPIEEVVGAHKWAEDAGLSGNDDAERQNSTTFHRLSIPHPNGNYGDTCGHIDYPARIDGLTDAQMSVVFDMCAHAAREGVRAAALVLAVDAAKLKAREEAIEPWTAPSFSVVTARTSRNEPKALDVLDLPDGLTPDQCDAICRAVQALLNRNMAKVAA